MCGTCTESREEFVLKLSLQKHLRSGFWSVPAWGMPFLAEVSWWSSHTFNSLLRVLQLFLPRCQYPLKIVPRTAYTSTEEAHSLHSTYKSVQTKSTLLFKWFGVCLYPYIAASKHLLVSYGLTRSVVHLLVWEKNLDLI